MDRNSLEQTLVKSPGYLFQERGLAQLLLVRFGGPVERSGVVSLMDLDRDIADRGRAYILRPTPYGEWALLRFSDARGSYKCLSLGVNYTTGEYFVGATRNRSRRVFPLPLPELRNLRLLPIRRCDIIYDPSRF